MGPDNRVTPHVWLALLAPAWHSWALPATAWQGTRTPGTAAVVASGWSAGVHVFPEGSGAHVRPHLVHVGAALVLGAGGAFDSPAGWDVQVGWPQGVLLLVVDEDLVGDVVPHVGVSSLG